MKVTVLVEDKTKSSLKAEHGLSFYIEYNNENILLDAGQSRLFMENAKKLGKDLYALDYAVLSHGHNDHGNGFFHLFNAEPDICVHAMEGVFSKHLSGSNHKIHEISIAKNVQAFQRQFIMHNHDVCLSEGVYFLRHHTDDLKKIGEATKMFVENEKRVDDFMHEGTLVFKTDKGLVVFNSCSHADIRNVVKEVEDFFGVSRIYAYVGGLHLNRKENGKVFCRLSEKELIVLSEWIQQHIDILYTGHCTGEIALEYLKKMLPKTISEIYTGCCFIM